MDKLGDARRLSIEEMKELAESKGGKCLSDSYKNVNTLMTWQCEKGHIWKATAASIRSGFWCHHCSGRYRHTIEDVREYAWSKGGLCLSETYDGSKSKLEWQCAEGHTWEASFHDVKVSNTWCPHCYKFYSEDKVRFIFESLFNRPFKKNRKALGENLELDGFNEELQLAFEYHGIQHYKHDSFFFRSRKEFERRKHLDDLKEKLCLQKGITLIIIPYDSYNSDESLLQYIIEQLRRFNIDIEISLSNFSLNDFYKRSQVLVELRTLAESRNGKLLSNHYINDKSKVRWQCAEGHTWEAIPNNIKNNSWCPYCSGLMRKSILDMHELAQSKGGNCLSNEYNGNKEKLTWQCSKGHTWEARPDSIVVGRWCPECSGRKKITIEDMYRIAEERGGKCLSTIYYTDMPLKWQCAKGHEWEALSHNVKKGQWCRKCSGHQKLSITEMREIAISRGGECLSDQYKDNKTKLRWKCSKGHEWEATPNNIKSKGHWCPICSRNQNYQGLLS
ncbi:zinc-ribbon domain-containing protein [Brevibacillus sp. 179-C9.3 HS]|uniref:zinc-ribbon domain-containing protein n=1 Tax=unclassified Brevibacillus TaxID=2684853 RepID=UPI0039A1C215